MNDFEKSLQVDEKVKEAIAKVEQVYQQQCRIFPENEKRLLEKQLYEVVNKTQEEK